MSLEHEYSASLANSSSSCAPLNKDEIILSLHKALICEHSCPSNVGSAGNAPKGHDTRELKEREREIKDMHQSLIK